MPFWYLEALSATLDCMAAALVVRQASTGDINALSLPSLFLWIMCMLAGNAIGICGYFCRGQIPPSLFPTGIAHFCIVFVVSTALIVAMFRQRAHQRSLPSVSLDWLIFAPFMFALTAGLPAQPEGQTVRQVGRFIEAFGAYLEPVVLLPQLVLLCRAPKAPLLSLSSGLYWLSSCCSGLDRLLSLYTTPGAVARPQLYANLATAMLLAEPLFGDAIFTQAVAERLEGGVLLEETVSEKSVDRA